MPQLRRRLAPLVVLLLLAASVPVPAQSPRPTDPELAAGIALVREGDFESAVLKLDTVVRRLLAAPGTQKDAALAYVYLGVAFLELNQELVARGKFQLAQALDPQMRLDPRQFSPEQIRVFDAARAETAAGPSPPPAPRPSASPTAVTASQEPPKKKKSPLLWILGGAAVVGGGVAAAAGGGGGGGAPPTTPVGNTTSTTPPSTQTPDTTTATTTPPGTTPTTTTPTTTPTTTTPTTVPAGCSTASVGPPNQSFYPSLGSGFCTVSAAASCNWSAAVVGNPSWVNLTTSSGTGSGQVRFSLDAYAIGPDRQATLFLVEHTSASCTITQRATVQAVTGSASITFTSELDLAGGQGQVVVDGASVSFQGRGAQSGTLEATPGVHRIEATVVSADGKPGTWRFLLAGPVRAGALRVIAGAALAAGSEDIVFRLSGSPGERVVFTFRSR